MATLRPFRELGRDRDTSAMGLTAAGWRELLLQRLDTLTRRGGPWALCITGVAAAVAIVVLPVRLPIQQPNFDGETGALQAAYLRAVVRNDPDDRGSRLKLVRQLLDLGRLDEARSMLEPLRPALAAQYYELMAARSEDDRDSRLAIAADWHRAAGDAAGALALYWQVVDGEEPAPRLASAVSILDMHLAAGDVSGALAAANELVRRFLASPEVLQRAVDVAVAAGEVGRAVAWAEQWLALQPAEDGPQDPLVSDGSAAEPSTPGGAFP